MKIAVYTIAKNEEQFVTRWYESAKQADYLLIADTGSTDRTVEIAKELGINVIEIKVDPWRFDTARNLALDALPDDIDWCIALDMDEVLAEGWLTDFCQEVWDEASFTRIRYLYTWSWKEDGKPDLQYGGDKIHKRHGYRWKHPVHEVLVCEGEEIQHWIQWFRINHHPDNTKSRASYFPLLKMAVEEDPDDDRNAFYYARELYFHGYLEEAKAEFLRHLSLPRAVWKAERAASYRFLAKCEPYQTEYWLLCAIQEDPSRREAYVELAQYYYEKQDWVNCLVYCDKAVDIQDKPLDYLCEEFAWCALPYDMASIACHNLGLKTAGGMYLSYALLHDPDNKRLLENRKFFNVLPQWMSDPGPC